MYIYVLYSDDAGMASWLVTCMEEYKCMIKLVRQYVVPFGVLLQSG